MELNASNGDLDFLREANRAIDQYSQKVAQAAKDTERVAAGEEWVKGTGGIKGVSRNVFANETAPDKEPSEPEMRRFSKLFDRKMDHEQKNFSARFAGMGFKRDLKDFREGVQAMVGVAQGRFDLGAMKDFGEFFETSAEYLKGAGLNKAGGAASTLGAGITTAFRSVAPYAATAYAVQQYVKPLVFEAVFSKELKVQELRDKANEGFRALFAEDFKRTKDDPTKYANEDKAAFMKEYERIMRENFYQTSMFKDITDKFEDVSKKVIGLTGAVAEAKANPALMSRLIALEHGPLSNKALSPDAYNLQREILGKAIGVDQDRNVSKMQQDMDQNLLIMQIEAAAKKILAIQQREQENREQQAIRGSQMTTEGVRNSVLWAQRTQRFRAVEHQQATRYAGWNSY